MRFDPNLNMVMRLTDEDGNPFVVHSTPVQSAVFEANWMVFRDAYEEMSAGRSMAASMFYAKRYILEAADAYNKRNDIVEFLNALASATFVVTGAQPKLLADSSLTKEMKDEVVNRLCFFIVFSRHTFPSHMSQWLSRILPAMNLELTSSSVMESIDSLTTQTTEEPTGKSETSVPI